MEKKKKKYNFKNVLVEVEFDSFKEMNVAKVVANAVHSNTDDIESTIRPVSSITMASSSSLMKWPEYSWLSYSRQICSQL